MLDRIYRALLHLLPPDFDRRDREEMWETYRTRVGAASGRPGAGASVAGGRDPRTPTAARRARPRPGPTALRLRELADLAFNLVRAWSPLPSLDSLGQDLRFGLRSLAGAPVVTALAMGSLALGLGVVTALFSALDVWLLRPLPLPNEGRLVAVGMANFERGWLFNPFSTRDFADWSREAESVELGIYSDASFNLAVGDRVERVQALSVSANLLDLLGIDIVRGRGFTAADALPEAERVAVVTEAFFQSTLGGDAGAIGRDLVLDGVPHTLIGVMHPDQGLPHEPAQIWRPLRISGNEERGNRSFWGVGLLAEGTAIETARVELGAVAARIVQDDPEATFPDASVQRLRDRVYGRQFQQGGPIVGLASLFVLLIACANIANVLLARGLARTHEMAVRGALGAGRGRLVQQLLVESLVIALVGGALGVGVAYLGLDLLVRHALPQDVPGLGSMTMNGRMLALAVMLTLTSTFVFGLVPALQTSQVDGRGRLAEGGRGTPSAARARLSSALVVAEIAASVVLLALSGLLIRAMVEVQSVDVGMALEDAVVFRIDVAETSQASSDDVRVFLDALEARLAAQPGVMDVAHTSGHFLQYWSTVLYRVPGVTSDEARGRLSAAHRRVSHSYHDALGLRLAAGRWFAPELDRPGSAGVAVVSRQLAERWWPAPSDALGQVISPRQGIDLQIVGVVEGSHLWGPVIGPPPPAIYEPAHQLPSRYVFWFVRHATDAEQVVAGIRAAVREMDPTLAVFGLQTTEQLLDDTFVRERSAVRVFGALGALALLLTLVGVYGVVAHSVGRRTHELGLRMALGADARGLVRMVLAGSARLAGVGLAIGVLVASAAGQALSFMLAGVSPRDPVVLGVVSALLLAAVCAASFVPAGRAARADPVAVMRGASTS